MSTLGASQLASRLQHSLHLTNSSAAFVSPLYFQHVVPIEFCSDTAVAFWYRPPCWVFIDGMLG